MSAQKGSNGIDDGKKNVRLFLEWKSSVKDFKPYIWQGLLNQSRIAREAGFRRGVFDTNVEIRDIHFPALIAYLEEQKVLKPRVAAPAEIQPQQSNSNPFADARVKQIQEESEAVKAENRELRAELAKLGKLKVIDEILSTTGRLPW